MANDDQTNNESNRSEGTNEELVLQAAAEVVDHSFEVMKWERLLRRFASVLRRSGLGAITGPGFAYVNAETGQVNFQALSPYRFGNFIDYLDGVAKAAAHSTTWVPAPVPVIGTVNVHIEQLHLDFGQQPPGESRGSSDGRVA